MGYVVSVRGGEAKPREEVETYLERLPDSRRGAGVFLFADEEEDVTLEVRPVGEGAEVSRLDVSAPIALGEAAAERAATFCFGLAGRFRWQVQDPASGARLSETELRHRFSGAPPLPARAGGCLSVLGAAALLAALGLRAPR